MEFGPANPEELVFTAHDDERLGLLEKRFEGARHAKTFRHSCLKRWLTWIETWIDISKKWAPLSTFPDLILKLLGCDRK